MLEGAELAPEDEQKINGEQKKFGFDGVTILGDGVREVMRKRIDQERGCEEQPAAGAIKTPSFPR